MRKLQDYLRNSALLMLTCFLSLWLFPAPSFAQEYGTFGGRTAFYFNPNSLSGSYKFIKDPTGSAPTKKIHSFTIGPECSSRLYMPGKSKKSHCSFQSVTSNLNQQEKWRWPKKAWYGWYMYLPDEFVLRPEQSSGFHTFVEWHNDECPHVSIRNRPGSNALTFETAIMLGDFECKDGDTLVIGDLSKMKNRWVRFEVYAEWSVNDDGLFQIFIDGEERLTFRGRNLTKGMEKKKNYFAFGDYLCCNAGIQGVKQVKKSTIYFAGIRRATTRDGLAVK